MWPYHHVLLVKYSADAELCFLWVCISLCVFTMTRHVPRGSEHTGVLGKLRPCKQRKWRRPLAWFWLLSPTKLPTIFNTFISSTVIPPDGPTENLKRCHATQNVSFNTNVPNSARVNLKNMLLMPTGQEARSCPVVHCGKDYWLTNNGRSFECH